MLYFLPFVALTLLYLLIRRKDVRIGLAIVGAVLAAVLGTLAALDLLNPRAPAEIPTGLVELTQLELDLGARTTTLTGRALNLDPEKSIYELEMELTLSDCTQSGCVIIGQDRSAHVQRIPPGQLRDIRMTFLFNDLPDVLGTLDWEAEVTALRARR